MEFINLDVPFLRFDKYKDDTSFQKNVYEKLLEYLKNRDSIRDSSGNILQFYKWYSNISNVHDSSLEQVLRELESIYTNLRNYKFLYDQSSFFKDSGWLHKDKIFRFVCTLKVTKLEEEVKTLRDEMNTVQELKNRVDKLEKDNKTLRDQLNVIKYEKDPISSVLTIQRYWRSYVLRCNVKKLARVYEEQMLREFRKNIMKSVTTSKVREAAENRKTTNTLPKKLKPGPSDPREWTERKANQVASDWMN